ncbi:hypothetical protein CERZMDRAFT_36075 [Cercospora zeae-maydis SCOH1-5]|uniref:Non-reducing end beta-L-arabinofuranosidase-like GH127 catalytic domain-containing protein n=1 Tax=Cercospora zeae-maydis SCOH1-5 TaxID=717836 RepID=A0A6A6FPW2_9PEZI|nr:hypothetical protein CERZMDRAFT_36075 [Cercospora zeae-maydis SCOH1-5]
MPPFAINSSAVSTNLGQSALLPLELKPLPLGSIKPAGWLRNELQLMSEGLAGHEHDFYDYVAHSLWLGGDKEYSGLNEGFPYWFNGIVPLAYGLDDERLKEQVRSSVQTVFEAQQDDGWLGPEKNVEDRNLWARFPFFLGLIQLAEADGSWTQPVVEKLHAFVPLMNSMLKDDFAGYYPEKDRKTCSIGNCGSNWGRIRMQDCMITLQWLYEYHPGNQSQMLLDNMKLLHDAGLNWEAWYTEDEYFGRGFDKDQWITNPHGTHDDPDFPFQHGVNVGQGFKAPAVVRRWNHNDSLITTAANGVNWTMQYHGSASGSILADERLVGLSPYSGSELCTTVETIYSFSYLYQALGINHYADSAELAAFNALPAAMAPDHWAHQYMTQPNQPYAEPLKQTPFYNVNNRSTIFGLEPQYVCCTVNHPQGWPKFLSNSWVRVGMTGIAHALLSPSSVNATVGGGNVKITCETAYPFLDQLVYTIEASQPCSFYVRVPEWAGSDSSIAIDQKASSALSPDNGTGLHRIAISEGTTKITYTLTSSIRTEPRANETVAVYKGALLYALEISNTNTSTLPNNPAGTATYPSDYAPPECRDFSYHNTSAWNYAIDPSTLQYVNPVASSSEETSTYELPNPVWAPRAAPGYIEVEGCKIDWPLYLDSIPGYPPVGDAKNCIAEKEKLRLVPYGTTKTHMSDLPVIELGSVEGVGAV